MNKKLRVAWDIDDTLYKVRRPFDSDKHTYPQIPDYDLIQVLRWFHANDHECFVWSAGGEDYAQTIVNKLGLTDMVTVIPKVALNDPSNPHSIDIAFDDSETKLARVDVRVKREENDYGEIKQEGNREEE